MKEPKVIKAGVRETTDDIGDLAWDIECRFDDGQKFAAIQVDGDFEQLADDIAKFLNERK